MISQRLTPSFIEFITPHIPSHLCLDEFIKYSDKPLRKSIRVNTLKISIDDFKLRMGEKQWQLDAIPWCNSGFWLTRPEQEEQTIQLGNTIEHLTGLFYIQEASSMFPPEALFFNNTEGKITKALDMASAPGSKTTQIAALMGNKGLLLANEYSSSRLKILFSNIQRCAVANTALTHMDGRLYQHLPEQFDAILLDAPCSGEGTVRKDPDSMKNWTLDSVHEIASTQQDLLFAAVSALKIGGSLIYSTCTLNPIENQNVVNNLLSRYPDILQIERLDNLFDGATACITEQGFIHVWPQVFDSEGFFVAKLKKIASIELESDSPFKRMGKFPYLHAKKQLANDFISHIKTKFGLDCLNPSQIYQRNNDLWYFPEQIDDVVGKVKLDRIGVRLAEVLPRTYKLDHNLAINFGPQMSKQILHIDKALAKQYLMGQDIRTDTAGLDKGEVLVSYDNVILGFAKNLGNRFKNQLPRELVKDNLNNI